jgi:predicted Zn-ribbon and HTH transcriptional regulator
MAALLGARGGVSVPDNNRKATYNHLSEEYKHWNKTPPEFKSYTEAELKTLFPDETIPVTCANCGKQFDYAVTPEVAMGAVACPNCKSLLDQTGQVLLTPWQKQIADKLNNLFDLLESFDNDTESITEINNNLTDINTKLEEVMQAVNKNADAPPAAPGDNSPQGAAKTSLIGAIFAKADKAKAILDKHQPK